MNAEELYRKTGKFCGPVVVLTQNRASHGSDLQDEVNTITRTKRQEVILNRLVNNSLSGATLDPQEEALLKRDQAAYEAKAVRWGDKDCGPLPMYNPTGDSIKATFQQAVKMYIAQGMDFKAAWLLARANNPMAYRSYRVTA